VSIVELDRCLERLRYAVEGEYVRADDLNTRVECTGLLRGALAERAPGDPLVDELDAILAKVRYVRAGDIIEPEDHNYLVDALRKARDILARLEDEYRVRLEAVEYALKYKQPVYGFTLGADASPHGRLPEPLRLVRAPSLVPLVEQRVYVGYTSPRTEILVEVKSGELEGGG